MPIIHESTPRSPYVIAGETFQIPAPYTEGHALTPNEAKALNQVFAENLRNNRASAVKEAKEKGTFVHADHQSALDEYAAKYEFGNRSIVGSTRGDPVRTEAIRIATEAVKAKINARTDLKLADYTGAQLRELAIKAIDSGKNPQFMDEARERVAKSKELAGLDLDSFEAKPVEAKKAKGGAAAKAD